MNRIRIDLSRVSGEVNRRLFGGHIEHNKRRVYGGIFDPLADSADEDGLRSDVKHSLEALKISTIRYPGGNFASGYHWQDGIGKKASRPVRHNLAWNSIEPNQFGTDEFMAFCRKLSIEPYICTNCGDGDMREAADWVDYCNGTGETSMAKLRIQNGNVKPYAVKLWGVGNEVDSPTQIGTKTPYEYARALTEYSKQMKCVDPSIEIVAAGVRTWEDHPRVLSRELGEERSEWVERGQLILEMAGMHIDYIALHRYVYPRLTDSFLSCMAGTQALEDHLTAYEGLIKAVSLNCRLKNPIFIAFDEWGSEPRYMHDDLEGALVTASYLNMFIRHANMVRIANFNPMMRSFMPVQPEKAIADVLPQTIFHAFKLYAHTCGSQALDVYWDGDTFTEQYMGRTYHAIRKLDVSATVDESAKRLVLYVVNRDPNETAEATISLAGGKFNGEARIRTLHGANPSASIMFDTPDGVVLMDEKHTISGREFVQAFEPHSLTVLEISLM